MKGVVFLHAFPYSPRMWRRRWPFSRPASPSSPPTTWGSLWERPRGRCSGKWRKRGWSGGSSWGFPWGGTSPLSSSGGPRSASWAWSSPAPAQGPTRRRPRGTATPLGRGCSRRGWVSCPKPSSQATWAGRPRPPSPRWWRRPRRSFWRLAPRPWRKASPPSRKGPTPPPSFPGCRCPPWSSWGRRTPSPLRRRPSACGRPSPTPHAHPSGDGPPRQPGKPQGLPHRASGFPRRVLLKPEGVLEG